jgi:predicted nuclease of restriction endonuclease-like (RecB) superfamily
MTSSNETTLLLHLQIPVEMKLDNLVGGILSINTALRDSAAKAINKCVTARNWLIGYYIVHYEQNGDDRAEYGERILQSLAERLGDEGLSYRNLRLYRQFFLAFPELGTCVNQFLVSQSPIGQPLVAQLQGFGNDHDNIWHPAVAKFNEPEKQETYDALIAPEKVFNSLSYSHLVQLLNIPDPVEKAFYEIEAIKGVWSKRELKRQIDSQLYLRTGISQNKDAVVASANKDASTTNISDIIRSPYTFEFLGLKAKDVVEESDLESALIDHLQDFLLELGNGFCFEARQKRILIDEKYYFYDLLFYNRSLHCGVIVELKMGELDYSDLAQLNMYVNYYKKNFMNNGDNPPIGILLCSGAGKEMVEYASPGIDENVFISTYMLRLPSKETLLQWLIQNRNI